MSSLLLQTDGYKLDHRRQYPANTQYVLSNFTPRASRVLGQNEVVFFGLQHFLQRYFGEVADETFFYSDKDDVLCEYKNLLNSYLGPNSIGIDHIAALWDLGYIPLEFRALPEGTLCPLRVPMFTVENTHPDFAWVTNYFETLISTGVWLACTSATTAYRYRKILSGAADRTGGDRAFVDWQGHDFSFRGMASPDAAALSGAAHLLSFTGTDTIPAIGLLQRYYGATGLIGSSVPATEHSVMCAGGQTTELETFERLLKLYPSGIVSVVSDTWDLWHVITDTLPKLKEQILARDGKLVIRPDSGDPADILCGHMFDRPGPQQKGVIELLWDIFGGTTNEKGFKVLDPHIGTIYGDSITPERAREITDRLAVKGFASTNVVLGIGSYTYNYVTRDTFGFAIKSTWAEVDGEERQLFKNPITDDGTKRSARGRIAVIRGSTGLELIDGLNLDEQNAISTHDCMTTVWMNGGFVTPRQSLQQIRSRLWPT